MTDRLLDTNAVSALMRRDPAVTRWLTALPEAGSIHLSSIVSGEVQFGLRRLSIGSKRRRLEEFWGALRGSFSSVKSVDEPVSAAYARLRASLESSGTVLPENDLWIAATALYHGMNVCTADRHFDAVPGLRLANWADS